MDEVRFNSAVARAMLRKKTGIGALGEKTLHSALKYYYEPDMGRHEQAIDGFFADIANDEGIIEIQTRSLYSLRRKLPSYLERGRVTVVHPVIRNKWIIWIDPLTGESSKRRKSPKVGRMEDCFWELIHIRDLLPNPNLTLLIPLIDVEEYRMLDGWSRDRKKGGTKYEKTPLAIVGEATLNYPDDYLAFLPDNADETSLFTVKEYSKQKAVSERLASVTLRTLFDMGILKRVGKRGNAYIYGVAEELLPICRD